MKLGHHKGEISLNTFSVGNSATKAQRGKTALYGKDGLSNKFSKFPRMFSVINVITNNKQTRYLYAPIYYENMEALGKCQNKIKVDIGCFHTVVCNEVTCRLDRFS